MARWSWWCCAIVLAACGCGQAEPDTTTARAKAAHLAGNFDEAIRLSTEAIAANPNDFDAFLCRGQAYHFRNQEGDYDRAVSDYTDAIDINPRMPEPFYRRALVYRDQGKLDLAGADDLRAPQQRSRSAKRLSPAAPDDASQEHSHCQNSRFVSGQSPVSKDRRAAGRSRRRQTDQD